MSSDSQAIFNYIFGLTGSGVKLEMGRVKQFMSDIGKPYEAYPVIHIAGTNGKGSTAAILSAMLQGLGFRIGLFTSPHLLVPNERIKVDGKMIPDAFIVEKVEQWRGKIETLGITFFEVLTALGLMYFKDQEIDFCVLETGLGGRLDATNVVDPSLSVITSISKDHENILGDTIEAITMEKAGIIKEKRSVLLGRNSTHIQKIISEVCKERVAPFHYVPSLLEAVSVDQTLSGQSLEVRLKGAVSRFQLPLLGSHQVENFANAFSALSVLDLDMNEEKIQRGLDALAWPGRMEVLQTEPLVLYDVAHNPDGLDRLMRSLIELNMEDAILLPAFNVRKNIGEMIHKLNSWSGPVLYTLFQGHSSVDKQMLGEYGIQSEKIVDSPQEALEKAHGMGSPDQTICFFGSHYLAEEIYPLLGVSHENIRMCDLE